MISVDRSRRLWYQYVPYVLTLVVYSAVLAALCVAGCEGARLSRPSGDADRGSGDGPSTPLSQRVEGGRTDPAKESWYLQEGSYDLGAFLDMAAHDAAVTHARLMARLSWTRKAYWHSVAAYHLAMLGQHAEAVQESRAALHYARTATERSRLYSFLGNRYWRLGDPTSARSAYLASVDADPENPDGWQGLGALAGAGGDYVRAAYYLRQALLLAQTPAEKANAHCGLGMALEMLGQKEAASHHYGEALLLLRSPVGEEWKTKAEVLKGLRRLAREKK